MSGLLVCAAHQPALVGFNDTMGGKSPIGCHVAEVILCDM